MNKFRLTALLLISLCLAAAPIVLASAPTGNIIITPPWPTKQSTPASLQISVVKPADPTYDPHVFLVMTPACYNGLTDVIVEWTNGSITLQKSNFTLLQGNGVKAPSDTISEKQYTRASLADHLGLSGSSNVYCAMASFLDGDPIHETPRNFTVTVHSTNPKMLVYALGKSSPTEPKFDRWVPPTNPGLVVPELGTMLLAFASFGALGLYAIRPKKTTKPL